MMNPGVFSSNNTSFVRPVYSQQENANNILNGSSSLMTGLHSQNPTQGNNLQRINAYNSDTSNPQEENQQLTALFHVSGGGYNRNDNVGSVVEDSLDKQDSVSNANCERTYNERSFLARQKITQAEAKYVCQICNRAFVRDDKLKRHIRCVHSHERPFVCEICAKAFARKDKLQEHARHHNRDITFTCPVCSDVFVMRSHLNRHLRTVHQMRPVTNNANNSSSSSNCNSVMTGVKLSVTPESGLSESVSAGARIKSFSGNGITYEKIKPARSKPPGKRSRKKTADSLTAAPILGKSISLSDPSACSPQPSAFSAPQPLSSMTALGGGANFLADSLLASGECLSGAAAPPLLNFAQGSSQAHHQLAQHQYGHMVGQSHHHHHHQQQQQQQQLQQQQEMYNLNPDMHMNYFVHQQHQQQQLHQPQQQQNQPPQHSALSAAMAASLFSPVNYVGWWPQASSGLMLHHPQHNPSYPHVNGSSDSSHHLNMTFAANSGATATTYPGVSQPEVRDHFSGGLHPVVCREQMAQQVTTTTSETSSTSIATTANQSHQFAPQSNDSQMVRPNAAAAAHVFASLPPLAQAVYYQAATLAATQNGGSIAASTSGNGPMTESHLNSRFASGAFQPPVSTE